MSRNLLFAREDFFMVDSNFYNFGRRMDSETNYIRANQMEEDTDQLENSGRFEWLKTLLFLSILFIVGFISIKVAGPMIFADYVPSVLGIESTEQDLDKQDGSIAKPEGDDEPVQSETGPESEESEDSSEEEPVVEEPKLDEEAGEAKSENKDDAAENEQSEKLPLSVYIVQAGDTLTSIAESNGLSVEEILAVNKLLNPHYLQLGQEILLP